MVFGCLAGQQRHCNPGFTRANPWLDGILAVGASSICASSYYLNSKWRRLFGLPECRFAHHLFGTVHGKDSRPAPNTPCTRSRASNMAPVAPRSQRLFTIYSTPQHIVNRLLDTGALFAGGDAPRHRHAIECSFLPPNYKQAEHAACQLCPTERANF